MHTSCFLIFLFLSFFYLFIYLRPFMQLLMESHLLNFAVVGNGE